MSIRTAEQLSDRLSSDLAWRKRELSEIKSLVEAKNLSEQRHKALLRSGICMLYVLQKLPRTNELEQVTGLQII
jgi:hypothetical protein